MRMIAPVRSPFSVSGIARNATAPLRLPMSERQAARPVSTIASDSSTAVRSVRTPRMTWAKNSPMTSPSCPSRWTALSAFGVA